MWGVRGAIRRGVDVGQVHQAKSSLPKIRQNRAHARALCENDPLGEQLGECRVVHDIVNEGAYVSPTAKAAALASATAARCASVSPERDVMGCVCAAFSSKRLGSRARLRSPGDRGRRRRALLERRGAEAGARRPVGRRLLGLESVDHLFERHPSGHLHLEQLERSAQSAGGWPHASSAAWGSKESVTSAARMRRFSVLSSSATVRAAGGRAPPPPPRCRRRRASRQTGGGG